MPDVGGIAGKRLRQFIERIERLEEEKRALAADIKEVYSEAKGTGFDTKIMRQIIRIRRMDRDDFDEQQTLLDIYRRALGMLADTPLGDAALARAKTAKAAKAPDAAPAPAQDRAAAEDAASPKKRRAKADSSPAAAAPANAAVSAKTDAQMARDVAAYLEKIEAVGAAAGRKERPTTEDCPYPYPSEARAAWERGWASTVQPIGAPA